MNSNLLSVSVYWSQIFLLLKKILKQINVIRRSFLWTVSCHSSRPGYVCWTQVCTPKSTGGLGFISLIYWNIAMVGKIAWTIAIKEQPLGEVDTCKVY